MGVSYRLPTNGTSGPLSQYFGLKGDSDMQNKAKENRISPILLKENGSNSDETLRKRLGMLSLIFEKT